MPSSISEFSIWSFRDVSCHAIDNFYNAFLKVKRQVHNEGLDFVCQNSFLRCGQVNSVLFILLSSSMILMIHLPQFLHVCNYFCFAGIVIETNCTLSVVEDKLCTPRGRGKVCLPSVRVCTTSPVQLLSLLFFLLRFQLLQYRKMISCSIHGVDEWYCCKEVLRNSSFLVE